MIQKPISCWNLASLAQACCVGHKNPKFRMCKSIWLVCGKFAIYKLINVISIHHFSIYPMIACMYFIAHLIHCKEKKPLHWLHFCEAKQILPRNVIAHRIIIPWKIVTRTQVALVQGTGNTSICSLPNSEIMVCKNWGIAVIGPSTPRPSKANCVTYILLRFF
jgi:hypothetical protein